MVGIGLLIADGLGEFAAELTCKPESLTARLEMLEKLVGEDIAGWQFQAQGLWPDGNPKPQKVVNWPGKPPAQSSGGGGSLRGGASTAWRNTEAGAKYEQERMDRRTALMQAVAAVEQTGTRAFNEAVEELTRAFYKLLRETVDGALNER
jgi:hypothetical protein